MKCSTNQPLFGSPPRPSTLEALLQRWNVEGARTLLSKSSNKASEFSNISLESLLCLTAEWGRSEPRLLEILLDWLWHHWKKIHPSKLNALIQQMPTPATWGILHEWTQLRKSSITPAQSGFWAIVLDGVRPENGRLFFSEGKFRSFSSLQTQIAQTRSIYRKWGFIGFELPSISDWKKIQRPYKTAERLQILYALAQKGPLTLQDYLASLGRSTSRQSAWRDLSQAKFLKKIGNTKGMSYQLNPSHRF